MIDPKLATVDVIASFAHVSSGERIEVVASQLLMIAHQKVGLAVGIQSHSVRSVLTQ